MVPSFYSIILVIPLSGRAAVRVEDKSVERQSWDKKIHLHHEKWTINYLFFIKVNLLPSKKCSFHVYLDILYLFRVTSNN